MTAQIPDILIHRGERYPLCESLLSPYLTRLPKTRRPDFVATSTALWRGYEATWEIVEGRLFLVALQGVVRNEDDFSDIDLAEAFPWRAVPIHATWVSKTLRCPEGRLRSYRHHGFAATYERDREFYIDRGMLVGECLVYNPAPGLIYNIGPGGERSFAGVREYLPLGDGQFLSADLCGDQEHDPFPDGMPVEPWRLWGDPDWGFEEDAGEEGYRVAAAVEGIHRLGTSPDSRRHDGAEDPD